MKKVLVLFLSALLFSCGKESTAPKKLPQIIVAPRVSNIQQYSADISWETDIAANSIVRFGEKAGTHDYTVRNDNQDTQHLVRLGSMKSNTQYFYIVESGNKDGASTSAEFSFTTLASLDQLFNLAWGAYQQKQYRTSISYFTQILKDNSKNATAMTGLGWCYASSAVDTLSRSLYYFDLALSVEAAYNDALAGRGLVHLALKAYNKTIQDLEKVLSNNSAYVFTYDTSIDNRDLRLALAMAYFYKMDYVNCQSHINKLVPNNNLNPEQAATWVVDGTSYGSYAEALLALIEKIRRG
jgi:hypothetical protein